MVTRSLFLSPEVAVSAFVTDKGSWHVDNASDVDGDIHTGDYNVLVMPALLSGYYKHPWSAALRLGYPVQFADLNLPHGLSADGTIALTEVGFEVGYALINDARRRFGLIAGVTTNLGGAAHLTVRDRNDHSVYDQTFEPDRNMRNLRVAVGTAYDFKITNTFSAGIKAALMAASLDLAARDEAMVNGVSQGEERIEMMVYSLLLGVRCRFDLPLNPE